MAIHSLTKELIQSQLSHYIFSIIFINHQSKVIVPWNCIRRGEFEKGIVVVGVGYSEGRQIGEGSGRGSRAKRGSSFQKHGVRGGGRGKVVMVVHGVLHNGGTVEGVEEPRLGFGVGNDEGEEEESDAGGGEAVVLVDEDVEVVVGGEGDEGIEVEVGKLVLDGEGGGEGEGGREVGNQRGEGGDGGAVH